jgi:hypothetical protein
MHVIGAVIHQLVVRLLVGIDHPLRATSASSVDVARNKAVPVSNADRTAFR